ncbi:MAG: M16 family metallopeptidase [Bacteroidota bacterium]
MRLLTLIAMSVLVALTATAQVDRSKKPEPGPTPQLKLPRLQHAQLKNGLKVIFVEHHQIPVAQMELVFQTGAAADPAGKAGLASLTAQMLDEGTQTRSALQIADDFDFIGARYGAFVNADGSFITLLTLSEHLKKAIELFSDVIVHPTFPDSEYARVQKKTLTALLQDKDQPAVVASNVFARLLYGKSHPYGEPVDGTETSVRSITIEDIRHFYETYYRPNNATLIIVGDIEPKTLITELESAFGPWEEREVPVQLVPAAVPPAHTTIYLIDKPNAPQSQIRVGGIGLPRETKDYYATVVLNQILGGTFNSRINWVLREVKGYTYGARSSFDYRKSAGPFVVAAGVKTSVTDSSIIDVMNELTRIRREAVQEGELNLAKASIIRSLPRNFETVGDIARQIATLVLYNLPDDYFSHLVSNIEAVTAADVQRAAQHYLHPDASVVVVVGDVQSVKEPLEKLGISPAGGVVLVDEQGNPLGKK